MKIIYSLLLLSFVSLIPASSFAQKKKNNNASYLGVANSVEYVSSMASRPQDLLSPDNSVREAKDKRSIANQIVFGQDPQTQDDYFVQNRHEMEQSVNRTPASLVFDTYSSNSQPTDPSMAVGPNHIMVVYNTGFMIYDKNGNILQGETAPNPAIFPSGGCCDLTASYDNAADRWVLSFLGSGAQVAVSDGPNPLTAGWYIYTISAIADYQKLSVWSDGYYITENTGGSNKIWALERDAMLAGNAGAQVVGFDLPGIVTSGFFSPQVLNVTDNNLPATGGATIVYMQDNAWTGVSVDHIKVWTLDMNWSNTASSTMSAATQINTTPFISVFDNGSFSNLTQPGGGSAIDALQATIMNQAQFRKFATYNSALFNFVVDADAGAGELAAVRWMELRQTGDNQPWSLYQEGTYTAPEGRHAWNASLAMDGQGNIGMGYTSMSGSNTPSTVRVSSYFTSRLNTDPLGTMSGTEELIANGNANISGTRYGDYSKIDVDPSDDSSFYFITEYNNNGRKGVVGKFEVTPPVPDFEDPTNPTNLTTTNVTSNAAMLTWTAATDNIGVTQYIVSVDGIVVGSTPNTNYSLTGLNPLTAYDASVIAQDAAGNTSGAATTSFTTLDGPAAEYCDSTSTNTDDEFISNVTVADINNTSGAMFYSDFTGILTDLTEEETYVISVTPTWTGTVFDEAYAAWIDYNNDGDFDDTNELIWSKAPSQDTPNTGSFTVPTGTSLASVRLRVSMKYNEIPTACETFTWGEVEDYTVNLLSDATDTEAPTIPLNLVASNETNTTIDLDWDASTDNVDVTGYEIFIDGLSIGNVTSTSSTVTGLIENTSYDFRVLAFDAVGNTSELSNTVSPTTTGGGLIAGYYFETGLEGWSDPGENCNVVNWASRSYEGNRSLRLRNGTETSLSESPLLDFTGNNTISIEFHTYSNSMESGETFYVELLNNGVYESIGAYVSGVDFSNGGFFTDTILLSGLDYVFSNDNRIRFRNGGNTSNDQIYFDQVIIIGDGMYVPTPPLMLNALNVGPISVDLNWMASIDLNSNGENGAVIYDIYQDDAFLTTTAELDYTVMNLVVDTTYSFYIVARDDNDNVSFASNTVTITTQEVSVEPELIAGYYFETGLEGWSDPGENCNVVNWGARSYEGNRSLRLRNGTETSLSESPLLDITAFNTISIEFHTYSNSMESGETFYVELLSNGVYETIGAYVSGVDFNNGGFFTDTIEINNLDYGFSNDNRIRFRNGGNTGNDQIYFDQVIIIGENTASRQASPVVIDTEVNVADYTASTLDKISLHPNPAESVLNIAIVDRTFDSIEVYSTSGQLVSSISQVNNRMSLDISSLASGTYFMRFSSNGFVVTKRFVKK